MIYLPVSFSQTQLVPWVCCHSSFLSTHRKQTVIYSLFQLFLANTVIESFLSVILNTDPQHLDVNDLIHVFLLIVLVPDKHLC